VAGPERNAALELVRQMFDLAAVVYRAVPSDENFFRLLVEHRKPGLDDRARLVELVYEVARAHDFRAPMVGHLAMALGMELRVQEATLFCELWLGQVPASKEGHRIAALLACERLDLTRARVAFSKLEELMAEPGTIHLVKTAMYLAFTDAKLATLTARQALASTPRDGLAALLAVDVAFRTDDTQLLVEAYEVDPDLAVADRRAPRAQLMLRKLLLELLSWRAGTP
jgi:hypothetical protein